MIRCLVLSTIFLALCACARGPGANYNYQPRPGQGQYVRPVYLNALATPRLPPTDLCRSQLYQGLRGQHEGAVHFGAMPGRKRVLKPGQEESFETDFLVDLNPDPPFIEVREYIAGQTLYAPSVRTVIDDRQLGPIDETRLTIELDPGGYITEIRCG